jgi:hypothetical protein
MDEIGWPSRPPGDKMTHHDQELKKTMEEI